MNNAFSNLNNSQGEIWILELFLGIAVLFLANFGLKRCSKYFHKRSLFEWKEKFEKIIHLPAQVILWVIGSTYAIDLISQRFGFYFLAEFFPLFRKAAIAACLAWILLRWKSQLLHTVLDKNLKGNKKVDAGMIQVVGRIASIAIIVLSGLVILQLFGLNVAPLIAFGGIGAAAVGFAAKDVIANFFGGFMLYITRPFSAGDLIILPDRQIEGYVEEIGWYLTSIRDKDKRPIYLPNAVFSHSFVINSSRMSHRRIEEKIGLRYEDFSKIGPIVEEMRSFLSSHPQVDNQLPVLVFFNKFEESSMDILVDVYLLATKYEVYLGVRQEILIRLHEIVLAQGAEIAYPTEVCFNQERPALF